MSSEEKNLSDAELAIQARSGSLPAFEALVFRYERRILAFVRHKAASREDAEDMTQQTFVTAFRKLTHYKPDRSFAAWLFTLARHQAIDAWRARRRQPSLPVEEVDEQDPARMMADREFADGIWAWARARLSENQFSALWLRVQDELTIKEIAQVMGLTQVHVKVLLHRGRQKLIHAWPERDKTALLEEPHSLRRNSQDSKGTYALPL